MSTRKAPKGERSGGNVFADLGLENSEELLVKSEMTYRIAQIIEARGLSRERAASILGIDAPKVSKLKRGSALKEFSYERLVRFLNLLGQDVDLVVRPRRRGVGHVHVIAA